MIIIDVYVFIFGAIIGSFLNVCIVRMPEEKSVVRPRSHCVKCKKTIPWYDNVPLFSYLLLRCKCRFCKEKISFVYFFVELLTAITFVLFYRYFGCSKILFPYLVMVSGFIVATMVDFKHRIIPDEISVGGMCVGLVFSSFVLDMHDASYETLLIGRKIMWILLGICFAVNIVLKYIPKKENDEQQGFEEESDGQSVICFLIGFILYDTCIHFFLDTLVKTSSESLRPYLLNIDASVLGLLVGGGLIYVMGLLGDLLFRKESMGGGDVKLLAMVGAFMGWKLAILSFFIAPFFAAIYGLVEKVRTKDSFIAYGPFLVLASLISLFCGKWIIDKILQGQILPF